jgi:adenosylcobinamide-GDP ribazoletransferase
VLRDGVLLAVGTLTAVRVPPPGSVGPRVAGTAMLLAPVVGLLPGGLAAGTMLAARAAGLDPLPAAVLAIGSLALVTRGLHLDGLADTADGLASGHDRARALEVMRRGDTGPAGAATLVLVLLLQVTALAQCAAVGGTVGAVAALVAAVTGRAALPVVCVRGVRAARESGLGSTVAGTVPVPAAAACLLAVALTGSAVTAVAGAGGWAGLVAVPAGAVAALVLLRRCVQRFGGLSGDVLGAVVETTTTATLLTLAAVLTPR